MYGDWGLIGDIMPAFPKGGLPKGMPLGGGPLGENIPNGEKGPR